MGKKLTGVFAVLAVPSILAVVGCSGAINIKSDEYRQVKNNTVEQQIKYAVALYNRNPKAFHPDLREDQVAPGDIAPGLNAARINGVPCVAVTATASDWNSSALQAATVLFNQDGVGQFIPYRVERTNSASQKKEVVVQACNNG